MKKISIKDTEFFGKVIVNVVFTEAWDEFPRTFHVEFLDGDELQIRGDKFEAFLNSEQITAGGFSDNQVP